MNRSRMYVANWKMNMPFDTALTFSKECKKLMKKTKNSDKQVVLCPTFPAIYPIAKILQNAAVSIGAQNCSEHEIGAYTGEVSAKSLSEIGCSYCIVGHSERRTYFHETNEIIARKVVKLLDSTINPIICIGETAQEQKEHKTMQALEHQLEPIIKAINESEKKIMSIIFAYEPVWAIGTGKTPDTDTLQEIFNWLATHLKKSLPGVNSLHFLYGGSVDAQTAGQFAKIEHINGFLIGGASLDFQKFKNIVSLP